MTRRLINGGACGIGFDFEKIAPRGTEQAEELALGAVTIAGENVEAVDPIDAARGAIEEADFLLFKDDDSPHGDGERADQGIFKPALGLKLLPETKQAGTEERRIRIGNSGQSGAEAAALFRVLRDARFAGGRARSGASLGVAAIGGDLCGCGHKWNSASIVEHGARGIWGGRR